jgi:hypothetical protein
MSELAETLAGNRSFQIPCEPRQGLIQQAQHLCKLNVFVVKSGFGRITPIEGTTLAR